MNVCCRHRRRWPLSTVAVHHSRKVGVASSILAVASVFVVLLLFKLLLRAKTSFRPESNQRPCDTCDALQSHALPTELQKAAAQRPVWGTFTFYNMFATAQRRFLVQLVLGGDGAKVGSVLRRTAGGCVEKQPALGECGLSS
ncbi:hypothetical protein TRVL_04815 [Trypanosoma vivax]|nr:hypothetical protein TRVL_04815 [Trypanosoma vivax]